MIKYKSVARRFIHSILNPQSSILSKTLKGFHFLSAVILSLAISACSSMNAVSFFSWKPASTQSARKAEQLQLASLNQSTQKFLSKSEAQSPNSTIQSARTLLQNNQPRLTIKKLHEITHLKSLSNEDQMSYYQLASSAYLRMNVLSYSTLARIRLDAYLTDTASQQANQNIIWHNLLMLSPDTLNNLFNQNTDSNTRGWVQLAIISKQNANNPQQLANSLIAWQQLFPSHPANRLLPPREVILSSAHFTAPSRIALLLPLHGPFGDRGKAVQNGFMAAFYGNSPTATVKLYDTSQSQDIPLLYQQAINEGAQFVVGPLTKDEVTPLARRGNIIVPTLTLNVLPENQSATINMTQFGLLPEQETEQMAEFMWQYGLKNILLITPQGDSGNKVRLTFSTLWQQIGGSIPATLTVAPGSDLKSLVAQALNIVEHQEPSEIPGKKTKIEIERRQDIDGIFIATPPTLSRQILPLLRYYYAGNLPVFSTSSLYSGTPNAIKDTDLNETIINDMPWAFSSTAFDALKPQFRSLWPTHFEQYTRLYALGVDSYWLSMMLPRLNALPHFPIQGATGLLFMGSNQLIDRQAALAQFKNGVPAPWLS